jgi:malto-oligosyltrehalose trehalohydrolase
LQIAEAGPGTRYRFVLPDSVAVPDPASRFQPQDVHGASEVIAPNAYSWTDESWRGRGWEECVIYELHVGAFTADGTFRAAIDRLDELRDLGITAIELMPVADFPGRWNWGYDGVLLFAPDSSYGRPEDLKRLVDAAHARGIAVILDVVYNHFGPDGNYLPLYSHTFTESHHTPWGAAVNYDAEHSKSVRDLIINNAVYWICEYNFDGLRLDAVHAIIDESSQHLLMELATAVREAGGDRHIHLLLENEENQASRLARDGDEQPVQFTAQ